MDKWKVCEVRYMEAGGIEKLFKKFKEKGFMDRILRSNMNCIRQLSII